MKRFPRIITALLMGVLFFGGPNTARGFSIVDHSLYARLLAQYVINGRVDYSGLKKEESLLDDYLKVLETTDTQQLDRSEQFAFYINAYNAWTLKLILSRYPDVHSIWDMGGRIFNKPFQKKIARIDGDTVTLDHIENDILRPRFKDPRVHFAINCAAKSCPPLRSEPYTGAMLDRQLNEMAASFINSPTANRLEGETFYVSKIFKWFSDDFRPDVLTFFFRFATADLKARLISLKDRMEIRYLDYDWSLNDTDAKAKGE
jgi:hypothetical protein